MVSLSLFFHQFFILGTSGIENCKGGQCSLLKTSGTVFSLMKRLLRSSFDRGHRSSSYTHTFAPCLRGCNSHLHNHFLTSQSTSMPLFLATEWDQKRPVLAATKPWLSNCLQAWERLCCRDTYAETNSVFLGYSDGTSPQSLRTQLEICWLSWIKRLLLGLNLDKRSYFRRPYKNILTTFKSSACFG